MKAKYNNKFVFFLYIQTLFRALNYFISFNTYRKNVINYNNNYLMV